jgi:hypothetical protein
MNPDDPLNQLTLPGSFVALFVPPGRLKPTASREWMLERYGLCEDLATLLTDTASGHAHQLGVTGPDVLERILRGLLEPGSPVDAAEARWVVRRLAELLDWPPLQPDRAEPG